VFFDRDGVINRSPGAGYVTSPDGLHLNDGVSEFVATVRAAGWLAIVITSQRCVGKGLIDLSTLDTIHAKMQRELGADPFDAIYAFTGLPGTESWEKPQPGMIEQACRDHPIDLKRSILIGDRDRDIEMANRAGVGTTVRLWIDKADSTAIAADHTAESIGEAAELVRELLGS
jgi:histidinol-phosphate phosphatase family protein